MTEPTDTQFQTPEADAARAIRAATPAADVDTTARIAARIAAGAQRPKATSSGPAPRPRRRPTWQPALAAGVLLLAAGVATLAPGSDDGTRGVGPRLAAAAELRRAGDTAYDRAREAGPLGPGEYQYVESSFPVVERGRRTVERRWVAADGATHVVTLQGSLLPEGTRYWVPASTCEPASEMVPGRMLTLGPRPTLPVGATPPACWAKERLRLELSDARGPIVSAPPEGAHVAILDDIGPLGGGDVGGLRFGANVIESDTPSLVPPGAPVPVPDANGPAGVARAVEATGPTAENPVVLPPRTSWVQVTSRLRVQFTADGGPGQPTTAYPAAPGGHWSTLFTLEEVRSLPSEGTAMLTELRSRIAAKRAELARQAAATGVQAAPAEDPDRAVADIVNQLLTEAPISPQARRALFNALARIAASGSARIERGVDLAEGGSAMRITFVLDQPAGYEDPTGKEYTYSILLDEETADLRATELTLTDDEPYITTWSRSTRTDSLRVPS